MRCQLGQAFCRNKVFLSRLRGPVVLLLGLFGLTSNKGLNVKNLATNISLLTLLLSCSYTTEVQANKYSGSGRKPPRQLSERQLEVTRQVIPLIPVEESAINVIALMMVESALTPTAVSHTGDYGIMQVNCRIWRDSLKEDLGIENCEEDLMDPVNGVKAGVYVLNRFKKYRQCRGHRVYACYNGGQGWKRRAEQCQAACEDDACKRKCWRPARYGDSVRRHIRFLKRKYKQFIEDEVLRRK